MKWKERKRRIGEVDREKGMRKERGGGGWEGGRKKRMEGGREKRMEGEKGGWRRKGLGGGRGRGRGEEEDRESVIEGTDT